MKTIQMRIFAVVAALMVTMSVSAQESLFEEADNLYNQLQYSEALPVLKEAYKKSKDKAVKSEIIFKIAQCYRYTLNTKNAVNWYKKAVKANYPDNVAQLYLAESLKSFGKYDEAKVEYEIYAELEPNDDRGAKGVESCKKAKEWMGEKSKTQVDAVAKANSKYDDFGTAFGEEKDDKRTVYLTSNRKGTKGEGDDAWTGKSFTDIFSATRDNDTWTDFKPLGDNINTDANEGAATLNAEGNLLFFTRCEKAEKKENKFCKIYVSGKSGEDWSEPVMLNLVPDSASAGQPALTPDGKTLYFVSDMPGGIGGNDIWKATSSDGKSFANPENLGSINTVWDDMWPAVKPDGTLYFASQGHISMGGLDIFKVQDGEVMNLKAPVNSAGDDFAIAFETSTKGYFTSNREGAARYDIYQFVDVPLTLKIKGVITDDNGNPVEGATVTIKGDDGTIFTTTTGPGGEYEFEITEGQKDDNGNVVSSTGTNYVFRAEKPGFFSSEFKETTIGRTGAVDLKVNFELDPTVKVGESIALPHIEYDFGKATLRPSSKVSLNKLIKTLNDNPGLKIQLQSHTDSRGSDRLNMILSQNRAKSVVEYLIQNGVASNRLLAKGYGETKLLFSDAQIAKMATEEEREAAHQRNRRTEFSIISYDFNK